MFSRVIDFGASQQEIASFITYNRSMRRSTALMLSAPSFAEIICASTFIYRMFSSVSQLSASLHFFP